MRSTSPVQPTARPTTVADDGALLLTLLQESVVDVDRGAVRAVVEQGLVRCGIRAAELGTEEVVELFYKLFNPGETEKPIQIT